MLKDRCIAIVTNIIEEVKLTYPHLKVNREKVMNYVGYDKSYLTKYREEELSKQVYYKLLNLLEQIDIDIMIMTWLRQMSFECSVVENKSTGSLDDPLTSNLDDESGKEAENFED